MDIPLIDFIRTLRRIGDLHSIETEDHAVRTRVFALQMGEKLKLSAKELLLLSHAADAHDFGKIFIDPYILYKPGKLNKAQRTEMEKHCELGHDALEFLKLPREIMESILYHQEHWDGSGYPKKLKGEQIPLFARIIGIADMWDALLSDRPYRPARSMVKALEVMIQNSAWFDPQIFDVFLIIVRGRGDET